MTTRILNMDEIKQVPCGACRDCCRHREPIILANADYLASDDATIDATLRLLSDFFYYADSLFKYPHEIIDALRVACENVLDHGDFASVEHLGSLATSVLKHFDAPWVYPDWRPATINAGETAGGGN